MSWDSDDCWLKGDLDQLAVLRESANDPRWRVREAVAMGLQRWGDADMSALLKAMNDWAKGTLLERRAAAAAVCEPRLEMAKLISRDSPHVIVDCFKGLLVTYVEKTNARVLLRGLRATSDFEYEFQIAHMNRRLRKDIEKVFLMPSEEYSFLSSSIIKEVASFGGSVSGLVPIAVEKAINRTFKRKRIE